jgi:hypothetical protein
MMKVNNPSTLDASKMLVLFQTAIKPLGIAGTLDHKSCSNLGEHQQRPVDRIQRYTGEHLPNFGIEHLC